MKNTSVVKSWSNDNLPLDLWPEILSRLPVKSLLRFRCVSRSWRSLIDDPDFCHLHLNRFKNNYHETHLLVVQGSAEHLSIKCSKSFGTTRMLGSLGRGDWHGEKYRSTATLGFGVRWHVSCSVDGLLLLRGNGFVSKELMLWNPSIRKSRRLPLLPELSSDMRSIELGLGFDPLIKDYKLVRVGLSYKSVSRIAIYTVGIGSWKTIQFQGKGCSNWCWPPFRRETVYLKGCLYFISLNLNSGAKELVSFDLSSEMFASTSLPAYDDPILHSKVQDALIFVDGGCSLAVFRFSTCEGSIWVSGSSSGNTTLMSWTKRCTFTTSIPIPKFLYLKKNGDMLLGWDQVTLYSIETHEEKLLSNSSRPPVTKKVWGYIESLILLK